MDVKITLEEGAQLPTKGTPGSNGLDLYAKNTVRWGPYDPPHQRVKTGLRIEIPEGYCGLILERSSTHKKGLSLSNKVGLIDEDFRGEIQILMKNDHWPEPAQVDVDERVAQLLIVPSPDVKLIIVDDLPISCRGENGIGSTG